MTFPRCSALWISSRIKFASGAVRVRSIGRSTKRMSALACPDSILSRSRAAARPHGGGGQEVGHGRQQGPQHGGPGGAEKSDGIQAERGHGGGPGHDGRHGADSGAGRDAQDVWARPAGCGHWSAAAHRPVTGKPRDSGQQGARQPVVPDDLVLQHGDGATMHPVHARQQVPGDDLRGCKGAGGQRADAIARVFASAPAGWVTRGRGRPRIGIEEVLTPARREYVRIVHVQCCGPGTSLISAADHTWKYLVEAAPRPEG